MVDPWSSAAVWLAAIAIGVLGTVVLDLYSWVMRILLGVPTVNWPMVGRWVGHLPQGQWIQPNIGSAPPVRGEAIIGWGFHYAIGAGYGMLVLAWGGEGWFEAPRLREPLLVSWALLVLPYFVMMPGLGQGIAARYAPSPVKARLKSVVGHTVFGVGMYAAGWALAAI